MLAVPDFIFTLQKLLESTSSDLSNEITILDEELTIFVPFSQFKFPPERRGTPRVDLDQENGNTGKELSSPLPVLLLS